LANRKSFVAEVSDAQSVRTQVSAVLAEMQRLRGHKGEGHTRADVMSRAGKNLGKRVKEEERDIPVDADMLVLVGGNLAHVYFPDVAGKITAVELEEHYPGFLENLVAQPQIGLVVTHMAENHPWVIGKTGARDLLDGSLTGESDPLHAYGDAELRAGQLATVARFPNAGDLMIISSVDEQGQVAAFEELIGSHGGIGGQQTDAFLIHPAEVQIPKTSSTTDLYPLLNSRRGQTTSAAVAEVPSVTEDPWSWPVMRAGMLDFQEIFLCAARSLRLDRSLFAEAAQDPHATGQAVLIFLLLGLGAMAIPLASILRPDLRSPKLISAVIVLMLGLAFCLLFSTWAGRRNERPNSFTRSFNAIAFAGVGGFVTWFAPLVYIGPLLLITGTLIVLVASWLAIQESLGISRWPAVLIPLLSFLLASLILLAISVLIGGSFLVPFPTTELLFG
jgi:hypothetical protein